MERRIAELEVRLTFQEKTIEELNEVLIMQQKQIDSLQEELAAVKARVRGIPALLADQGEEPPPPHY